MEGMFSDCWSLETLDLSSFNTSRVTNMKEMFSNGNRDPSYPTTDFDPNSWGIITMYVSDSFVVNQVSSSSNMFEACTRLTGSAGTRAYDHEGHSINPLDKTYARVDKSAQGTEPAVPGYFTKKTI